MLTIVRQDLYAFAVACYIKLYSIAGRKHKCATVARRSKLYYCLFDPCTGLYIAYILCTAGLCEAMPVRVHSGAGSALVATIYWISRRLHQWWWWVPITMLSIHGRCDVAFIESISHFARVLLESIIMSPRLITRCGVGLQAHLKAVAMCNI